MNSVVQYMSRDDLNQSLAECARVLRPAGALIVSDLIPPDLSLVGEAVTTALRHPGFLLDRVGSFWFEYLRAKRSGRVSCLSLSELGSVADSHGFNVRPLADNLTHLGGRRAAILRKKDGV